MAVGVSVTCMPTTSAFFRNLRTTYKNDHEDASSRRRLAHQSTATNSNTSKSWWEKLGVGFGGPLANKWRNLDDSEQDLGIHDPAALELGNHRNHTVTTVIGGDSSPHEHLGDQIYYSRSIHAGPETK